MEALLNSDSVFIQYILLPFLIFSARILDVSAGTIRLIFISKNRRVLAPLLGFAESLIWLLAAAWIFQNLNNPVNYIAFAAGFATGNWVGLMIENKIALGKVILRVITRTDATELVAELRRRDFGVTAVDAEGRDGPVKIIFMLLERQKIEAAVRIIKEHNPRSFYSIEDLRFVSQGVFPDSQPRLGGSLINQWQKLKKHK